MKLLLIEDDKQLSAMYSQKFTSEGWNVTICHEGSGGVQMAKETNPDIIVLDLMLPGLSGIEVLELLRQDGKTAKTPIVIYTNYGDKYNREKCLTYGADEFVLKVDSTPESLFSTVKKVAGDNAQKN